MMVKKIFPFIIVYCMMVNISYSKTIELHNGVYEYTNTTNSNERIYWSLTIIDGEILFKINNIKNQIMEVYEYGEYLLNSKKQIDGSFTAQLTNTNKGLSHFILKVKDEEHIKMKIIKGTIHKLISGGSAFYSLISLSPEMQTLTFKRNLLDEDYKEIIKVKHTIEESNISIIER